MLESVGQRVARLREARGWSQSELARQSGVLQSDISRLESGKTRHSFGTTINALGRALGVSADYLLTGDCPGRPLEKWMVPASYQAIWEIEFVTWSDADLAWLRDRLARKGQLLTQRPALEVPDARAG